jgi:hypothetical protein
MRAARHAPLPGRGETRPRHPAILLTRDAVTALTDAHTEVQTAKTDSHHRLDTDRLAELRDRYDKAVDTGIIHNRHRDWDSDGNHPAFTLAVWLKTYADQVWHFTRHPTVDWTSNAAERGVKPAKRHQAVSRLLAQRPNPEPLVPDQLLPHHHAQPRPDHPRRHHPRPVRPPLATRNGTSVTTPLTAANP